MLASPKGEGSEFSAIVTTLTAMAFGGISVFGRPAEGIGPWVWRLPDEMAVATIDQALLLPLVAFAVIALMDPPLHRR